MLIVYDEDSTPRRIVDVGVVVLAVLLPTIAPAGHNLHFEKVPPPPSSNWQGSSCAVGSVVVVVVVVVVGSVVVVVVVVVLGIAPHVNRNPCEVTE